MALEGCFYTNSNYRVAISHVKKVSGLSKDTVKYNIANSGLPKVSQLTVSDYGNGRLVVPVALKKLSVAGQQREGV